MQLWDMQPIEIYIIPKKFGFLCLQSIWDAWNSLQYVLLDLDFTVFWDKFI